MQLTQLFLLSQTTAFHFTFCFINFQTFLRFSFLLLQRCETDKNNPISGWNLLIFILFLQLVATLDVSFFLRQWPSMSFLLFFRLWSFSFLFKFWLIIRFSLPCRTSRRFHVCFLPKRKLDWWELWYRFPTYCNVKLVLTTCAIERHWNASTRRGEIQITSCRGRQTKAICYR